MPTHRRDSETPIVYFDPAVEISPFTVFRRLREGLPIRLFDVRANRGRWTLSGAEALPELLEVADPPELMVLFDDDGSSAVDRARELQAAGHPHAKALFGGLELYAFSLDPEVVGAETYLVEVGR